MLSSGSWFHITFGFILGIVITIFTIVTGDLLKRQSPRGKLARALILFSIAVTFFFYLYISAIFGGILVEWKFLGFPAPGDPAVKILDIGYVETRSGTIYRSTCLDCQDKKWEPVSELQSDQEESHVISSRNCATLPFLPWQQRTFVDSKSACTSKMWDVTKIVYAIDREGHVYSWIHQVYPGDIVVPWYIENAAYIAVGVGSAIFGTIIMVILIAWNFITRKIGSGPFTEDGHQRST